MVIFDVDYGVKIAVEQVEAMIKISHPETPTGIHGQRRDVAVTEEIAGGRQERPPVLLAASDIEVGGGHGQQGVTAGGDLLDSLQAGGKDAPLAANFGFQADFNDSRFHAANQQPGATYI